ncbi:MAG: acyltransferase [Bryobacteraceae bacterium]|jgi:peptidoglycan/LPS O-acetylase OafA/YrhL
MRIKQLDALRSLAVFMVLGTHFGAMTSSMPILIQIGWTGVDLFFVLSGFLISGLLFREYKVSGNIRVGHFLARRSIKLYPAYYTLIIATIVIARVISIPYTWGAIWPSIVFVQNYYTQDIWGHLWSMAVEEHFYVLLPIAFWLAIRTTKSPFDRLPQAASLVMIFCLICRCVSVWHDEQFTFPMQSHLRFDGLAFGVLISYFWEFRPEYINNIVRSQGRWLLCAAILLLSPQCFLSIHSPYMYTIGLTSISLGYGGLLIYSVKCVRADNVFISGAARIGVYSYTIYLVHAPVLVWTLCHGYSVDRINVAFCSYISISIVLGILFAKILGAPVSLWKLKKAHTSSSILANGVVT